MTAPDVVIPVRYGQTNPELRYALRSLRNIPHGAVHIVGFAPRWVNRRTVNIIPSVDALQSKHHTVLANMRRACLDDAISEEFVLFNDDTYVMSPLADIPVLNRGRVDDVVSALRAEHGVSQYVLSMIDTRDVLVRRGHLSPLSFELHTPMPMRRGILLETIDIAEGRRFNWRTAYGALAGLTGETIADVKVYAPTDPLPTGPFLSTSDQSFRWFSEHIADTFPEQSEYER